MSDDLIYKMAVQDEWDEYPCSVCQGKHGFYPNCPDCHGTGWIMVNLKTGEVKPKPVPKSPYVDDPKIYII